MPQINNKYTTINFLLEKYKTNTNSTINLLRNNIINFFANILNRKITINNANNIIHESAQSDYKFHIFENIYYGTIKKYIKNYKTEDELREKLKQKLINLVEKQNMQNK